MDGWMDVGGVGAGVPLEVSIELRLHRWLVAAETQRCAGRHRAGLTGGFSNLAIVSEGLFLGLLSHYAVMVAIFCLGIWLFLGGKHMPECFYIKHLSCAICKNC